MKPFDIVRIIIPVVLTVITLVLCKVFPNASGSSKPGVVMELPEILDLYKGFDREVSEEEKYWLPKDTQFIKKVYVKKNALESGLQLKPEDFVNFTIILSGSDSRSLHRPEVCLDGQGWDIVEESFITIDVDGKNLDVKDLKLRRVYEDENGATKQIDGHYLYWWVGKNRSTPHTYQRVLYSALDNVFKNVNSRWAYPSVMVYADESSSKSAEELRDGAIDLIKKAVPHFQISMGATNSGT